MDSPAATAFFAGLDLNFTGQHDTHLSAQHTVSSVAGESASLFTHAGGIQAIAANGPLSLQAHLGTLDILADDSLTITSVNGHIDIRANEKIVLYCDGAAITLEGPNITLSGNEITVKALIHGFGGPGQGAFNVENLPDGTVRAVNFGAPPGVLMAEALHMGKYTLFKTDNRPFDGYPYDIRNSSGKILDSGLTDAEGKTTPVTTQEAEMIKGYKSIMRESERITEHWQGKLASAAMRANTP